MSAQQDGGYVELLDRKQNARKASVLHNDPKQFTIQQVD